LVITHLDPRATAALLRLEHVRQKPQVLWRAGNCNIPSEPAVLILHSVLARVTETVFFAGLAGLCMFNVYMVSAPSAPSASVWFVNSATASKISVSLSVARRLSPSARSRQVIASMSKSGDNAKVHAAALQRPRQSWVVSLNCFRNGVFGQLE
jgi:hypothetical protein